MVRRVAWLALACACTQDFSVFEPDGSVPNDGGADVTVSEGGQDASAADVAKDTSSNDVVVQDVIQDVAPDALVPCTETGAIMFGGHCYFLVTTTQKQAAAATFCQSSNAHLVTITTAQEQAAVIALGTSTERWTGLFRATGAPIDANYAWITAEPRNGYSAWSPSPTEAGNA